MKNNVVDEIILSSKGKKTFVFFDMDGTLADYDIDKDNSRYDETKKFYLDKRPLKSIIKIAKMLSKKPSIEVEICSNCHYEKDKFEKLEWLNKFMPFLNKENIIINVYEFLGIETPEQKHNIKKVVLLDRFKDRDVIIYHIDDDVNVIRSLKHENKIRVIHISSLIN